MASAQKSAEAKTDAAIDKVQASVDVETEQGYRGFEADPTPDAHYTVDGVTSGKPTPETDPEHAAKVRAHLDGLASRGEVA